MRILPFGEREVFSDYHDLAFDISVFYLFCCPLSRGVLAPVLTREDKIIPLRFMIENKVTVWSSVPSVISRMQSFAPNEKAQTSVKIMFLCGEPFNLKVLQYCLDVMGITEVHNFYGLTETGVENFHHKCFSGDLEKYAPFGFVPIGKPLEGNDILVTEDKELLLSGIQVTPGYLGGIGGDRFEVINGKSWFHTGDIVEEHCGVYFCKGRLDSQVKLSGYRVELMDIEVNIKHFGNVDEVVCFVMDSRSRKTLAAAVKTKRSTILDLGEIKSFLARKLPHYMIPNKIFTMEEMPVNKNGKIDRRKIKEMFNKEYSV